MKTSYVGASKLRQGVLPFSGLRTQAPFTSWSWNMLGISFLLNGIIAYMAKASIAVPQYLLRAALLCWEIAAPNTVLVAFVVRYAIWPMVLKKTGDTSNCRSWRALVWHNANVVMALFEMTLLGGLPVKFHHISLNALFGIAYVVFTWLMMYRWVPGEGPHFIYFFFDITLGKRASMVLFALLTTLVVFFALFAGAGLILDKIGHGMLLGHVTFMVIILCGVCRFRD